MSATASASFPRKIGHKVVFAFCLFLDLLTLKLGRFVFDTTFARHVSLLEGRLEIYEKAPSYKGKERASPIDAKAFPLLASACPGWICYAEKKHGEMLPYISTVKSPQQVMGSLVKEWLGPRLGIRRAEIYHISIMPCYDKKLEASRPDFTTESGNRDVDCVLTTGEVQRMLTEHEVALGDMLDIEGEDAEESILPSLLVHQGSASGGYLHNALQAAIEAQPQAALSLLRLETRPIRGEDYVDYFLRSGSSILFRGAKCYGFRNLQNVVRKVGRDAGISVTKGAAGKGFAAKRSGLVKRQARAADGPATNEADRGYDFIEVMACPSGCINGGGQISPPKHPPPIEIDQEGMPLDASEEGEYKVVASSEGHRVLSGKEWVARVEEFYWRVGATKIVDGAQVENHTTHTSIRPFLQPVASQTKLDHLAETILREMTAAHMQPEEERKRLLRTQYRAIESGDVNGLAVKW